MDNKLRILHLETLPHSAALVERTLTEHNLDFYIQVVDPISEFTDALEHFDPHIILAVDTHPSFDPFQALATLRVSNPHIPFILLTGAISAGYESAIIHSGADDYLAIDRLVRLPLAIINAIEKYKLVKERAHLQQKVLKDQKKYFALLENTRDVIYLINKNAEFIYQSPSATALTGYVIEELLGKRTLDIVHPEDKEDCRELLRHVTAHHGETVTAEYRILHRDGHYTWAEGTITNLLHDSHVNGFVVTCRDITERKKAEAKLIHANRLYAFISSVNKAIISAEDQQTMFNEVCRIAIEIGNFKAAWIETIDSVAMKSDIVSGLGLNPAFISGYINIPYASDEIKKGVLKNGTYYVCNNISRKPAYKGLEQYGLDAASGSFIVLPIRMSDSIIGTFNLLAPAVDFFNSSEIALLEGTTEDLSFALAVFEKERQKLIANNKVKHSEFRLNQAQAVAHIGSWEVDVATGDSIWSEELLRIYALSPDEKFQTYESWLSFIHPDDVDGVLSMLKDAEPTLSNISLYHRIVRRDGTIRRLHLKRYYEVDEEGQLCGIYGVAHDITDIEDKENALRESESRYSKLFHMSPQPGWVYDPETLKFFQVNKAAIDHYGYSEAEFLVDMTILDLRPVSEVPRVKSIVTHIIENNEDLFNGRYKHLKKSGEMIDVDIYGSNVIINDKVYRSIIAIDVTEKKQIENKITKAIIKAQEDERYEIGSELHDNVCQLLACSQLNLGMLQENMDPSALGWYTACRDHILRASKEIRNLSHRLAPAFFDHRTLQDGLNHLIRTFDVGEKFDIRFYFDPLINSYPLTNEIQLNLYRIIQEQLRNILKHAEASDIYINIQLSGNYLQVSVSDNGAGCNVNTIKRGIGFANMKRRAELFYGRFDIISSPGNGCEIRVELPLAENNIYPAGLLLAHS